jgi:zinc protease
MRKLIQILIIASLLAILVSTSYATSSIENVEKVTLPNGLTLVLDEQPSRDLISLCLFVDGGGRIESEDVSGISHFIEHLIFRGPSKNSTELELRQKFRIWGEFEGYTSDDLTCYGFTVRPDDFDDSLDAFVDGVMNLTIPQSVIDKERTVITSEINQRIDMPLIKMYDLFDRTAFKFHSYGNTIIGPEELIQSLDSDVIREYYKTHYTPDHFVIGITGNFEKDKMVSRMQGAFDSYSSSNIDFERGITEPPQKETRHAIEKADVNAMHLLAGWRIPPAKSDDIPGLEVLSGILGGSEDSRLYKALKTDRNLVDEIYCFADSHHDENFLYVYAIGDPLNQDEIISVINGEVEKLKQTPPDKEELQIVKTRITNDYSFNLQTFWDIASYLAQWELYGDLEQGQNYVRMVDEISPEIVSSLAEKYLISENMTWVTVVPSDTEQRLEESKAEQFQLQTIDLKPGETADFNLRNSAKAIYKYDTSSDIVGISILAGLGQVMENDNNRGIGEFTSRMLLKGCGDLNSEEFRKRMEEIGCRITSASSRDFINISMEVHKDKIDDALDLFGDVVFKPRFDESEIEIVREEIISAIERKVDDPFGYVNDGFFGEIYGKTPYAIPLEGTSKTIKAITSDDLKKFHELAFSPKFQVVGASGNIDSAQLMMLLDKHLGKFTGQGGEVSSEFSYPVRLIPQPRADETILKMPRSQVSFNMGMIGVSANDPDYPAVKLLVQVLGLRLFDKYVYELGWAYRMWFYMPTRQAPAPFMFEMGVASDKFDEARQGLIEAMKDITMNPVSDDELAKTKKYVLQSFYLGMQKNADTAYNLAFYEKTGLGYKYVFEIEDKINGIKSEDLLRVAKKYFNPETLILFATIPESD